MVFVTVNLSGYLTRDSVRSNCMGRQVPGWTGYPEHPSGMLPFPSGFGGGISDNCKLD